MYPVCLQGLPHMFCAIPEIVHPFSLFFQCQLFHIFPVPSVVIGFYYTIPVRLLQSGKVFFPKKCGKICCSCCKMRYFSV